MAVDIFPPEWFGVDKLTELLGSRVEYVRASVYELAERFPEPFDLVLFWGVLYHLRHPLLALDNVRAVTRGQALLETAVCDGELRRRDRGRSLVAYYPHDELSEDPSNWFSPTVTALEAWCAGAASAWSAIGAWPPAGRQPGDAPAHPAGGPARVRAHLVRAGADLHGRQPVHARDVSEHEEELAERFDPASMHGKMIEAEHVVRYAWAAQFARGRRALDAGCGAAYGSRMLAEAGAERGGGDRQGPARGRGRRGGDAASRCASTSAT